MMDKITIRHGGSKAVIQALGAEMISYIDMMGMEYIYDGNPKIWKGQSPVLFPSIGKSKNDIALFSGVAYPMCKHGFARDSLFQIEEVTSSSVTMLLEADSKLKKIYPFTFAFRIIYTLHAKGFSTTYHISNYGNVPMPFMVGGHPAFICPMENDEHFEDYEIQFEKPENGKHAIIVDALVDSYEVFKPLAGRDRWTLDRNVFSTLDTLLLEPDSKVIRLVSKKSGKGVQVAFADFPVLALWTTSAAKGKYLCIEPWQGLPSMTHEDHCEFKDRPYVKTIDPKECYQASFDVSVLD